MTMAAERQLEAKTPGDCGHFVQFFDADDHLVSSVGNFLGGPIGAGGAGVLIATPEHLAGIEARLTEQGLDVGRLRSQGRYVTLDAQETLDAIRVDGRIDSARFAEVVGGALAKAATHGRSVRVFGEVVALLWAEGRGDEAARLEELWNDLGQALSFTLLCGYPTKLLQGRSFEGDFGQICAMHTKVIPAEDYPGTASPDDHARWAAKLQHRVRSLDAEVAELAKMERALKTSEHRYRRLFETARDGILLIELSSSLVVEANPCARRLLGRTLERIVGRTPTELGLFTGDTEFRCAVVRLRSGEQVRNDDLEIATGDGVQYLEMLAAIYEEGGHEYVQCSLRDVTARRQAELASAHLAAIVESSHDGIVSKTLDGIITSWNHAAQQILGYAPGDVIGKPITMLIPGDRRQEEVQILSRIRAGERVQTFETQRIAKDGRLVDVSLTVSPIRDARGRVLGGLGLRDDGRGRVPIRDARGRVLGASKILRDITAHRRAEAALMDNQHLLNVAMEAGNMGAWAWDARSGRVSWSPTLETLHGLAPGSFAGTFEDAMRDVHPEDRDRVLEAIQQSLRGNEDYAQEYRIVLPGGAVRWVGARGRVVRDQAGAPIRMSGVCADVTERRLMEESLRQSSQRLELVVAERTRQLEETHERLRVSDRMAALGTLSTGIGHDMGNLLLPIHVRVQSLEAREIPKDLREDLLSIRTCVEYLQRLAKGLRLLALDPETAGETDDPVDLGPWWAEVLPMMQTSVPRGVTLEGGFPEGLPPLAIPKHQLTHAVFNLVQNAGSATRDVSGGRIRLEGRQGPGPTVLLRVTDNGVGMSPEVKARCAEPFFTTRARSLSTGLGLSLVAGVVERAGGSMTIESTPGEGTAITLALPGAAPRSRALRPRGVVDLRIQSPRTRSIVASLLKGMGVIPAEDGSARLLVTDTPQTLNGFLSENSDRHAVTLGGVAGPRTHATPASPRVTELRDTLRTAVDACYPTP